MKEKLKETAQYCIIPLCLLAILGIQLQCGWLAIPTGILALLFGIMFGEGDNEFYI